MEQKESMTDCSKIEEVQQRIEHWRSTREKHSPMPAALWEEATVLARQHGIHRISRALRVNYESLKKRVVRVNEDEEKAASLSCGFVELKGAQLLGLSDLSIATVELTDGAGGQMRISLPCGDKLDVASLVESFCRRR